MQFSCVVYCVYVLGSAEQTRSVQQVLNYHVLILNYHAVRITLLQLLL